MKIILAWNGVPVDDKMVQAMMTVIVNDQAYLYASVQALEFKNDNGYDIAEDVFLRMQDEFKEEFAGMVGSLMTHYEVNETLDAIDPDGFEYESIVGEEEE